MKDPRLEVADPQAYVQMIIDRVGNAAPLQLLGATPDRIAALIETHPIEHFTEARDSRWNPSQIIGHLVDTEFVFGFRLRFVLSEPTPVLPGMDQDLWVNAQRYAQQCPLELLESFRGARVANLRGWKSVTPTELERSGQHDQRGPESLGTIRLLHAGHDLHHLAQLEDTLALSRRG